MNLFKIKTSSNLLNWWNFGSLIGTTMMIQIILGFILSMNYMNNDNMFISSMNIYFNMNYGWMIRLFHSNLTSFIFLLIIIHLKRNLFFKTFLNKLMWYSGLIMLLLIMLESFIGYSLIWNQMSYWAMMVITNFLSSIPIIGNNLMLWVWGNFNINKILINRFFSMHFFIPLIIVMLIFLHLMLLHLSKSSNPLGMNKNLDLINLNPLQLIKDLIFFLIIIIMFLNLNFFFPFYFNNNDNFNMMNYFKTPSHIEPEWYFLFFFSILRSINNKFNGLIILMLSIFMLFLFPMFNFNKFQYFFFLNNFTMTIFLMTILFISILSTKNPEYPYLNINIILIYIYFIMFFVMYKLNKLFLIKF